MLQESFLSLLAINISLNDVSHSSDKNDFFISTASAEILFTFFSVCYCYTLGMRGKLRACYKALS